MRIFTNIFGLITALIISFAVFLKNNHYPGSSISLIFSLGLLLPIYLLFVLIVIYKQRKVIGVLITPGIFALFFIIGVLFLLMHWPGGRVVAATGYTILILYLLVLSIVYMAKKPEEQKLSPNVLIFTIIGVCLIYGSLFRNVTKGNLISNLLSNDNEIILCKYLNNENKIIFNQIDSINKPKYENLRATFTELINYLGKIKADVCVEANDGQKFSSYDQIQNFDHPDIAGYVLNRDNSLELLKGKFTQLKFKIESLDINKEEKQKIEELLTFGSENIFSDTQDWTDLYFRNVTVISAAATLSSLQARVLICENKVYSSLIQK